MQKMSKTHQDGPGESCACFKATPCTMCAAATKLEPDCVILAHHNMLAGVNLLIRILANQQMDPDWLDISA